jgi:hypothetical protein
MKLHEEGRARRFSIQDAVAVFSKCAGFSEDFRAEIRVGRIAFPTGETPYLIQMISYGMDMAVSLQTAYFFTGASSTEMPLRFGACRLAGAIVDYDGNVQLTDETWLHAVKIEPARICRELTGTDLEILRFVIARYGDIDRGYGYLGRDDVRRNPDSLDFSTLSDIKVPPLKVIEIDIREERSKWPKLVDVTYREIGRALGNCGLHRPRSGPRSKRAPVQQASTVLP